METRPVEHEVRAGMREGRFANRYSDRGWPDYSQRQRLMPFVGKYVRVNGTAFERNGTHAIVITDITEMKGVQVTLEEE